MGSKGQINELAREVHQNAVDHGWWDGGERPPLEILMLCTGELSEAAEEFRCGRPALYVDRFENDENELFERVTRAERFKPNEKPEGWAVELADCIIRIMDYCGHRGIDLETIIRLKHEYNKTRPYRHGGKVY